MWISKGKTSQADRTRNAKALGSTPGMSEEQQTGRVTGAGSAKERVGNGVKEGARKQDHVGCYKS